MGKIEIPIDASILFEMYQYAAYAKHHFGTEIAGWGHYNKEDGIYKLAPLMPQVVSGAEVESFPDEILNSVDYNISDMIVQWHSHVDMGCAPSSTDNEMIEEALKLMPMIISIIVNCHNEYTAMISFSKAGMFEFKEIHKVEANLSIYYNNVNVSKLVKKKLKRKVIIPTIAPYENNNPYMFNDNIYSIKNKNPMYGFIPKSISEKVNEEKFERVREVAHLLSNNYIDIELVDYGEHLYLIHYEKNILVDITPEDGIIVNNKKGCWNDVLLVFNVPKKKYHKYSLTLNNSK